MLQVLRNMLWRTFDRYIQYSEGLCLLLGVRFYTGLILYNVIICSMPPAGFPILMEN